jgi:uncharacterized protein YndB with AHSA1/START domain
MRAASRPGCSSSMPSLAPEAVEHRFQGRPRVAATAIHGERAPCDVGRRVPGWDGVVRCEVLEVEAPRLLRYTGIYDAEQHGAAPAPTSLRAWCEDTLRPVVVSA